MGVDRDVIEATLGAGDAIVAEPSDPHGCDSREPRSLLSDLMGGLKAGGCAVVVD